jgi:hypothetical protein
MPNLIGLPSQDKMNMPNLIGLPSQSTPDNRARYVKNCFILDFSCPPLSL